MTDRSLKSYLYEGIVIVASIIVAFALDASWANYQESRIERRVLAELHDELESAKTRINVSISELEGVIAASFELAEFLGTDTAELTPDQAEILFLRIHGLNTLEVPMSVFDSIIASGQARLISNIELRKALAAWPALVYDVRENHEWHRVATDEVMVPHFAKYLSIRNAFVKNGITSLNARAFEYDIGAMQRDVAFEGQLLWQTIRQQATLNESNILLTATENLLALIAAEIE